VDTTVEQRGCCIATIILKAKPKASPRSFAQNPRLTTTICPWRPTIQNPILTIQKRINIKRLKRLHLNLIVTIGWLVVGCWLSLAGRNDYLLGNLW
jgi:hypothetical protein